ncbi:hypothetical protein [Bifidobacterium reuteri]|uniref:hypothetical protein n=1 Tax=Bifidobacterium reuteri TaxID=983706 RepID=UPI001CC2E25B|nr:hypothetical protein [Bifidobacterium reuteri]
MGKVIKSKVVFTDPRDRDDDISDYTVPIPEGLTEEFHPSQPVTPKQIIAWETRNEEPYPGYAEELFNWENAWEEVNRAQLKADGGYLHISDPEPVEVVASSDAVAGGVKDGDGRDVPVYGDETVFGEFKDVFETVFGGDEQFDDDGDEEREGE